MALATFRVAKLLYEEDGPWDIFKNIRSAAGIETVKEPNEFGILVEQKKIVRENFFSKLLDCPYCISGWVSIILFLVPHIMLDWLAIWGLAFLILKGVEDES